MLNKESLYSLIGGGIELVFDYLKAWLTLARTVILRAMATANTRLTRASPSISSVWKFCNVGIPETPHNMRHNDIIPTMLRHNTISA